MGIHTCERMHGCGKNTGNLLVMRGGTWKKNDENGAQKSEWICWYAADETILKKLPGIIAKNGSQWRHRRETERETHTHKHTHTFQHHFKSGQSNSIEFKFRYIGQERQKKDWTDFRACDWNDGESCKLFVTWNGLNTEKAVAEEWFLGKARLLPLHRLGHRLRLNCFASTCGVLSHLIPLLLIWVAGVAGRCVNDGKSAAIDDAAAAGGNRWWLDFLRNLPVRNLSDSDICWVGLLHTSENVCVCVIYRFSFSFWFVAIAEDFSLELTSRTQKLTTAPTGTQLPALSTSFPPPHFSFLSKMTATTVIGRLKLNTKVTKEKKTQMTINNTQQCLPVASSCWEKDTKQQQLDTN